jgi:hypothetical protein
MHSRIRLVIAGSSIAARSRSVEPQRGQRKASMSKTRWRSAAHRVRRGEASAGELPLGFARSVSRGAWPSAVAGARPLSATAAVRCAVASGSRATGPVPGAVAGTTWLRWLAQGARIPWYRTWWARGGGISGTSRSSRSLRSRRTWVVPSRQRVLRRKVSRSQGVEVEVQVESRAEALEERHCAALFGAEAPVPPNAPAKPPRLDGSSAGASDRGSQPARAPSPRPTRARPRGC